MPSNFHIFTHHALPLAQLDAPITPRSWVLNGFGKAEFSVGTQHILDKWYPKEETIFEHNNIVHIEHVPTRDAAGTVNGKLPDWTGIILPDRTWNLGVINMTAYSAEAILTFRPMPLTKISGTPAAMFKQLLGMAQAVTNDIVIQPGVIEEGEGTFTDDLATSAYVHINKLCQRAGMNWDVTAQVDTKGKLQLYANLYRFKGSDTRLDLTSDNVENSSPLLSEQGTPYNVINGYSQASTKEGRLFKQGRNEASIAKYGVLAANHTFSGITDSAALKAAAQAMADASPPVKMVRRVALDVGKTYDNIAHGNIVTVKDTNAGFKAGGGFGFETSARILSLDYNDLTNKAPLNLEIF